MFHEGREIEIAKYIFVCGLDGVCNLSSLIKVVGDFRHLTNEEGIIARVGYWPVQTRKYLRGIACHKAGEVSREDLHCVTIDKLGINVEC